LFQYVDESGEIRNVNSSDVNAYLKEISGEDITAKDFRTWHGTVLAAMALNEFEKFNSQADAKRNIRDALDRVASCLGNTPTICRKCYVHPEIMNSYVEGSLCIDVQGEGQSELRDDLASLASEEAAVLSLLRARSRLTLKDKLHASVLEASSQSSIGSASSCAPMAS
jgi:DNA topoisomerase I